MQNPSSIYERLVKEGEHWADCHAAAELLEGALKSMFSQCVQNHRKGNHPVSECEHMAYTDPDYTEARTAAIEARREANKARVRYKAAEAWVECLRTAEASERAANRVAP